MNHDSVSDQRWHRNTQYPALSAEGVKRLQNKLDTLSTTCDKLAKENYEQEQRIQDLEKHIAHLNSLTKSYEDLIVAKVGYRVPDPTSDAQRF